ncbi:MAG TPA: DTW domain-containing protein [Polyangiaceae bacterium]|nr:DTW domain-containing protein [Polyangiaceae bacterium]
MSSAAPETAFLPRSVCQGCARPSAVCLCSYIAPVRTRTRVVILQHPRESTVPVGTARLAELSLANAERHIGVEFADSVPVRAALGDPSAPAVLLFPGDGARDLATEPPSGPVTLCVIDGTWWQAAKLVKKNPQLLQLPRYALNPAVPSRYRIRREPAQHCVSTIEAIVEALCILERDPSLASGLLAPFDAMVEQQLGFAERRQRRHVSRPRAPRIDPLLQLLASELSNLVVGYGEANAWPRGTPLGPFPELVHWAAERVATGERFEAFVKPEHPLAPSFTRQTALEAARFENAMTWPEFRDAWAGFQRPSDLLCGWGFFSSELIRTRGAPLSRRLDVRRGIRQFLRAKPGDISQAAERLNAELRAPWAPGRTGVRLAALSAIVRNLASASL